MSKKVGLEGGDLDEVRERFDSWRRSHKKSKTIPQELLDAAAVAAQQLGVNRVARTLGLNHTRLKHQVTAPDARSQKRRELQPVPAQFIEVGAVGGLASTVADPMVVELVTADGARLTIRTRQASASVLAMITAFRGQS
jgi:hypothetical protein